MSRAALPTAEGGPVGPLPGLRLGSPGDRFEQEADRVAERVMAMSAPEQGPPPARAVGAPALQRKTVEGPGPETQPEPLEEEAPVQVSPSSLAAATPPGDESPPDPGNGASSAGIRTGYALPLATPLTLTRGGAALLPSLRLHFESRFGRDLTAVRVHLGPEAVRLCAAFQAHAFTYGSHVWLGSGHAVGPTFLMAHELAHVVQQRQPPRLPRSADAPHTAASPPAVRALNLSLPFWVPLGRRGMLTGPEIHQIILGPAGSRRGDVDVEAPAPNGERSGFGLNFKGRIDLFRGIRKGRPHAVPGLYFAGRSADTGQVMGTGQFGRPTHHPFALAGGTYSPRVLPGSANITRITLAPDTAEVGELKPADRGILAQGEEQLNNYRQGLADAARQTNAWSNTNLPRRPQWNLAPPTNLPPAAVDFGPRYRYTPGGTPGAPYNLTLAIVEETPYEGGKYRFKPLYGRGEQPIEVPGGLYAGAYQNGMWVYFARPNNLGDAMAQTQSRFIRGQMTVANQVQNDIINDMFQAPEMVEMKPLARSTAIPPLSPAAEGPTVRFRKKLAKIKDHFKFPVWQRNFKAIHAVVHSRKKEDVHYNKVLKFLELAYKAEDNLGATTATGKSSLPDKTKDPLHIQSNPPAGPGGKPKGPGTIVHKPLADLHSWLWGWTSPPVEFLGRFRSKVGLGFVAVADKLAGIRKKLRAKMKSSFHKHSGGGGGGGLAGAVVRILGRILVGLVRLWAPHTLKLTVHAILEGVKKKLKKELDLSPEELLTGAYKARLWKWEEKLTQYRTRAETLLHDAVEKYGESLNWIKNVIDTAQNKIGPVLEVIIIGVQCASPPIIGCLKLILRRLQNWAIEKVLGMCDVRQEMAGIVAGFSMVQAVPRAIAQKILDVLRKVAPSGLEEIFDERVPDWSNPDGENIDCDEDAPDEDEEQPPPPQGTSAPDEDQKAIARMVGKHGTEKVAALGELAEKMGLPSDTVLLEEFTARLDTLLDQTRATPQEMKDLADGKAAPDVKQRLEPLTRTLEERRKAAMNQAAADLRSGKLDHVFRRMEQEGRQWEVLGDEKIRDGSPRKVVVRHGKHGATGIARIDHGPCKDGRIMLIAAQPDLEDAKGKKVDITLKDQEFPGDRTDPPCLREPAPPKPKPGEEGQEPPVPAEEGGEGGEPGEGGEGGKPRLEEGGEPGNKPVEVEEVPGKPEDKAPGGKPGKEPGPKPETKPGPEGPEEEVEPEKPEGKEPRQGVPPPKEEIEEEGGPGPGPGQPPGGPQGEEPAGQEGGPQGGSQGGGTGQGGSQGGQGTGQGGQPGQGQGTGRKGKRQKVDPRKKGRIPPPPPSTEDTGVAHFAVCDWMECPISAYPVLFEPQGEKAANGWYVQTGDLLVSPYEAGGPATRTFMLYPRNKNAILTKKPAQGGGWDIYWVGKRQGFAGKAITSPLDSRWIELVSGEAYDSLQEALKTHLRNKKIKPTSTRIHLE